MSTIVTTHAGVEITVNAEGVFSALVGPRGRKAEAPTLDEVRDQITRILDDEAGAKRKDVNIPFRFRVGDQIHMDCVYIGIRADGRHAIKVPTEKKPVKADDYSEWSANVVPDTVPFEAIQEFRAATLALQQARDRHDRAGKALHGSRLPWHANPQGDMRTNAGRATEQARFVRELLSIKNRGIG